MIIDQKDVRRLKSLVLDIERQQVPWYLTDSALYAFFVENPHLLIGNHFDEHMRLSSSPKDAGLLTNLDLDLYANTPLSPKETADMKQSEAAVESPWWFSLPRLNFRTAAGRWATLISCPRFSPDYEFLCDLAFSFGFKGARQKRGRHSSYLYSVAEIRIALDDLVSRAEISAREPKNKRTILWTPRLWTLGEQERQRHLINSTLEPYFERWKESGMCFADLNPSEFEDLVGEVLFQAGLNVYKVRNAPQGGRDLIARGVLIPGEEPIEMAVEVKHRPLVDRPLVELALHQNQNYPALLFVTSGRFTAGVLEERMEQQ